MKHHKRGLLLQPTGQRGYGKSNSCTEGLFPGQDDVGEVPLGVFYLPDPEEDAAAEPLYHVLESGATLVLTVSPTETAEAVQIQLAFWPEEAAVPKTAAWYAAAVVTAWRGLALARVTGDAARETALRQRLHGLYQSLRAASGQWQDLGALTAALGQWLAQLAQSAGQWLSDFWTPEWVGQPATAAAPQEDAQTFSTDQGEITITCAWRPAYRNQPAYMSVAWEADLALAGDLWVQFRQLDTEVLLSEIRLGPALRGDEALTLALLGFDPSRERWALAVVFKETAS
jgi:hypothetical protein